MDLMTEAWVNDPLKAVLRRIGGFARAASGTNGFDAEATVIRAILICTQARRPSSPRA